MPGSCPRSSTPPLGKPGFLGREGDLLRLRRVVGQGAPHVAVLGPPGSGTTRLVIEAFPDATWIHLEGADGLSVAAASAIGLPLIDVGATEAAERVREAISRHRGVFVLDGRSELDPEMEEALSSWLRGHGGLTLVRTGQSRSELPGEVVIPVDPLAPSAAEELLRLRATQAGLAEIGPSAVLGPLLAEVDGLPWLIEVAAPWLRLLAPSAVAERIARGIGADRLLLQVGAALSSLSPSTGRVLRAVQRFSGPSGWRTPRPSPDRTPSAGSRRGWTVPSSSACPTGVSGFPAW